MTNDSIQGAAPMSQVYATTNRASKQLKALRKWEANGERGKRPDTTDLDYLRTVRERSNQR